MKFNIKTILGSIEEITAAPKGLQDVASHGIQRATGILQNWIWKMKKIDGGYGKFLSCWNFLELMTIGPIHWMLHVLKTPLPCHLPHEDSSGKYPFMTAWDSGPQTSVSRLEGLVHIDDAFFQNRRLPQPGTQTVSRKYFDISLPNPWPPYCKAMVLTSYSHCGSHAFFIVLTFFATAELCVAWEDKGLSILASISRHSSSLPSVHQITNQGAATHGEPQAEVSGGNPWDVLTLVFLTVCD